MDKPTPEILRLYRILSGIVLHYLAQQKDKESITMKEVDMELLRTLADLEDYEVEEREDGSIVLTTDSPTFGGWHIGSSEGDVTDAINQLTYNVLHPID